MFNLILKDILIQKKTIWFTVFYSIFAFFAFSAPIFTDTIYTMVSVMIVYILILTAAAYDEKNKSDIIINSLPVKRDHIIIAKYLSMFAFIAIALGTMGIIGAIVRYSGLPMQPRLINYMDIIATFISVAFLISIYFPLYFKFGSIHVRIFNTFLFLAVFFIPSFAGEYMQKNKDNELIKSAMQAISNISDWVMISLIVSVTLIILLISLFISIRVYRRKDL